MIIFHHMEAYGNEAQGGTIIIPNFLYCYIYFHMCNKNPWLYYLPLKNGIMTKRFPGTKERESPLMKAPESRSGLCQLPVNSGFRGEALRGSCAAIGLFRKKAAPLP